MTEDQRFAASRTDVLVYETDPLEDDLTIAGPIKVNLQVSTSGTDSDFVVKLIDVYPGNYPTPQASSESAGAGERGQDGWLSTVGARRTISREVPERLRAPGGDDSQTSPHGSATIYRMCIIRFARDIGLWCRFRAVGFRWLTAIRRSSSTYRKRRRQIFRRPLKGFTALAV